jgi:O-antigen/teichoic acid export membrane protein
MLLLISASLIGFGLVGLGEVALTSFFLVLAYKKNLKKIKAWRYSKDIAREMLSHSWPLILSGLTVMIYMRIDQIMIGQMLGDKEVGLFSVAVRLSEIWYFVPMGIASSVFPAIMSAKKHSEALYLARIQQLYDFMTWLGIFVAVVATLLAPFAINLMYGGAYAETASVLSIQIWAGVAVCMSFAHGKWLITENLQKYSMYYTAFGAVLNVTFNLILIPICGIKGAAIATLIAQFSPNLLQIFIKPARQNLKMMLISLIAPYKYGCTFFGKLKRI